MTESSEEEPNEHAIIMEKQSKNGFRKLYKVVVVVVVEVAAINNQIFIKIDILN